MVKIATENTILYFWGKIKAAFVTKETGKGLTANDLTNTLKSNYDTAYTHSQSAHAPVNAEANVQADWAVSDTSSDAYIKNKPTLFSGSYNDLTNKPTIPSISGLATETYVQNAVGAITSISYEIVEALPASGAAGTIYLLSNSGNASNIYDEYIWVNNAFEKIGTTAVDLSGYVQTTDLVAISNAEIDTITAS